MDIFELFNIEKAKDLKKYLKKNSVEYRSIYGNFVFAYEDALAHFNVGVIVIRGHITGYEFYLDDKGLSYDDKVNKILEIEKVFTEKFGKPELNSTNHLDNTNIVFQYNLENVSYRLECQKLLFEGDEKDIGFIGLRRKPPKRKELTDNMITFIGSMIGGFIWGILMYLVTPGWDLVKFGVYLAGGVLFGLLLFLGLYIVNKIRKKNPINKKLVRHFNLKDKELYPGVFGYFKQNKNMVWRYEESAVLEIDGDKATVYAITKKEDVVASMSTTELYYKTLCSNVVLETKYQSSIFAFKRKEDKEALRDRLYELIVDKNKEEELFNSLKEEMISYNPLSVFDSKEKDSLDEDLKTLTRIFLTKDNISRDEMVDIIAYCFRELYYGKVMTDKFQKIYENITGKESEDFFG